ncbi:retrovirus-related pol polyprotein from transposon TNT 1-94 [Tanacetum coccineum]
MSSNSDDIQAAGSDTRPPMLDRTDYESWSQRIRLYYRGKENGLHILQSIDQGPFELGTTRNTLGTTPEGGKLSEQPIRDFKDYPKTLTSSSITTLKQKQLGQTSKAFSSMCSELTKEDRESQLYDEFEQFKMLPGENINEYCVRFHKLVNDMRNIRMTMPNKIQLNSKYVSYYKLHEEQVAQDRLFIERITPTTNDQLEFVDGRIMVQNVQGRQNQNHNQMYLAWGNGVAGNGGAQNRARNSNTGQDLLMQAQRLVAVLDRRGRNTFLAGEIDECDAFDLDFDDELTAQSIFMANLSSAGPANLQATLDHMRAMKAVFEHLEAEVDHNEIDLKSNEIDLKSNEIEWKNILIANENLIAECLSKDVFYTATDYVLNALVSQNKDLTAKLNKDNREVHLYYIKHLKESVKTLREIVEEAKVERPLDISLASACRYTKHSQELLEHVISMCPKDFNPRDKQNASTTLLRKKRVTFVEPCETSTHNTPTQVEHQKINSPNASGISSTGVKGASTASGSNLRSNTKKDRTLPAKNPVRGLPRLKFDKDHLCSACQLGKSRKATHKPKTINTIMEVLHTLHMDLCGSCGTEMAPGTEFVNKDLTDYYESVGITHEKTIPRTPQQNGVVERRNRTLVEVARTMLIFSKAPLFLWAEAVATACYTQNRSLIHTLHDKTPYELVHDKKSDLSFLHVFRALCYPINDNEDLGKLKAKADIGQTTPVHSNPGPVPNFFTPGPISSGLVPNPALAIPYVPPTTNELETLFQPMFDEYFENPPTARLVPPTPAA